MDRTKTLFSVRDQSQELGTLSIQHDVILKLLVCEVIDTTQNYFKFNLVYQIKNEKLLIFKRK